MDEGKKPPNPPIDETDFSDIGFEEPELKRKEAEIKAQEQQNETLTKEVVYYLYENFEKFRDGQELDVSLAQMNPECKDIVGILGEIDQQDIITFLKDYRKIKYSLGKKNIFTEASLKKITEKLQEKGYSLDHIALICNLEILSLQLGTDIVSAMIARNNLEKKASAMIGQLATIENQLILYSKIHDEIQGVIGSKKIIDINLTPKQKESLTETKKDVDHIIDIELLHLKNKEYEFASMKEQDLENYHARLSKIKSGQPEELLNLDNFALMGLLLEKRMGDMEEFKREYEKINSRIGKYFPMEFPK